MSTIVQFTAPSQNQSQGARHSALLHSFASHRRSENDVFWLKENAELLNILECTGSRVGPEALRAHEGFYENIENRMGFFPQYYRFLLSICLDLEDLGMEGNKAEILVNWVADHGMAEGELSDLQRFEARRLMARRGRDPFPNDHGLEDRIRKFCGRPITFSMPNKKAAYELTHSVFYLSEYGRKDPELGKDAIQSLENAGILAFLDQNADLLAEVCIAMRYVGVFPADIWEKWLLGETHRFGVKTEQAETSMDDYHEYFVCNWAMSIAGNDFFAKRFEGNRMSFHAQGNRVSPLRAMSECMYQMEELRTDDWERMRQHVIDILPPEEMEILNSAEQASSDFGEFFSGFARVGL